MKKFKASDAVEILGTDGVKGFISTADPSNTEEYLVALYDENIEAVYPYYGSYRLYPEHMLTHCNDSIN